MRAFTIVVLLLGTTVANARDVVDGKPARECVLHEQCRKKPPPPPKTIDITNPLGIDGRVRTISMLQFIERASAELEAVTLEKKSFVPKIVQSVDEESL